MIRFAAAIGGSRATVDWGARARSAGLTQCFSAGRVRLFTAPEVPVHQAGSVLLVGWVKPAAVLAAADRRPAQVLRSGWGSYLLIAAPNKEEWLLRDPGGRVPCYHLCTGGTDLFVSDAATAQALAVLSDRPVDERFLCHWLQFPHLRSQRTGLQGVGEILPGAQWSVGANGSTSVLAWSPTEFASSRRVRPFAEEATALRRAVIEAVAAQLRGRRPLLKLSGGLDSSIIAAALHAAAIPFEAVTFATSSSDGDEQAYAELVATRFKARLGVVHERVDDPLPAAMEPAFRPTANLILRTFDDNIDHYRRELGCALLVDGGGGDNLFGSSTTAAPAADALLRGRGLASIGDVARRTHSDWWTVARALPRQLRRRVLGLPWPEDRRFLHRDAMLAAPDLHPWLAGSQRLLPGKQEHVASLVHIQHFFDRQVSDGNVLHPLFVQPLLEHCLSLPSWQLIAGGCDRAVARAAFEGLLPAQILARRTKGSLEGLFHRRMEQCIGGLRELILSGELMRRGLLDGPSTEAALQGERWRDDYAYVRLSEIATLELWLRGWVSR